MESDYQAGRFIDPENPGSKRALAELTYALWTLAGGWEEAHSEYERREQAAADGITSTLLDGAL